MTLKDQIIWWNARNGGGQRLIGQPDRPIDKENTRKAEELQLQNSNSILEADEMLKNKTGYDAVKCGWIGCTVE